MPEVVECHRITGEDCYLVKAHVRSMTHLEEIIDRFTPFGQTTTSIIQSSPVHAARDRARRLRARWARHLVDRGPAGHEAQPRRAQV